VQQALRAALARWGKPCRLRVDNGKPWGSRSDLPPALALWLIGLGVEVAWNPPRRPQDNGVVERSQGTAKRWAEPHACRSVQELQRRLDDDDVLQREHYPLKGGRSRWEVFPALAHSGRPYCASAEAGGWDMGGVLEHLAGYAVPRRVDRAGRISVYNHDLYVGTMHRGKTVHLMVDPQRCEWLVVDTDGCQLRSIPATVLTAERIRTLTLNGSS
jgi:hypothetical protein